jgi:DNA polymerase III sliding clamp (beta) subunit (PCNA family)
MTYQAADYTIEIALMVSAHQTTQTLNITVEPALITDTCATLPTQGLTSTHQQMTRRKLTSFSMDDI